MESGLKVNYGQYSDKGAKPINQDFHGLILPAEPELGLKGIAIALADGFGSSEVSQVASETAVRTFLQDYYCTADTWPTYKAGERVLSAINGWLFSQTNQSPYRHNRKRGYLCTISALVIKHRKAHLFHVGDSRIYRINSEGIEQLTRDHHTRKSGRSYLNRALGGAPGIEIDYQAINLNVGDILVLATDGAYSKLTAEFIEETITDNADNLDRAAELIATVAIHRGCNDNVTVQAIQILDLPRTSELKIASEKESLPLPAPLSPGDQIDHYQVTELLSDSPRSLVYKVQDIRTQESMVLKIPAPSIRNNYLYLEHFLVEDWIAQRINSAYVSKPIPLNEEQTQMYHLFEYTEGTRLDEWLRQRQRTEMEQVISVIEQLAKGLAAFHRLDMLHRGIRPENVVLDGHGHASIVDFGSACIPGLNDLGSTNDESLDLSSPFTAPECLIGQTASYQSDQYSLAVLAYFMLTGRFPYGTQLQKYDNLADMRLVEYQSVRSPASEIPIWLDPVLKKATHVDPGRRYKDVLEFVEELRGNPIKTAVDAPESSAPESLQSSAYVWKLVAAAEMVIIVALASWSAFS